MYCTTGSTETTTVHCPPTVVDVFGFRNNDVMGSEELSDFPHHSLGTNQNPVDTFSQAYIRIYVYILFNISVLLQLYD